MTLLRIKDVGTLDGYRVRLTLTNEQVIERDLAPYLRGPLFEPLLAHRDQFVEVHVVAGSLAWPNGADLCPDTIIWGGMPPQDPAVEAPLAA